MCLILPLLNFDLFYLYKYLSKNMQFMPSFRLLLSHCFKYGIKGELPPKTSKNVVNLNDPYLKKCIHILNTNTVPTDNLSAQFLMK